MARFTNRHSHPALYTFTWDGTTLAMERMQLAVAVIEYPIPIVPMDDDTVDVPDMVRRWCSDSAIDEVEVTYHGYYQSHVLTLMVVLPPIPKRNRFLVRAEWDLCAFPDGTTLTKYACAAQGEVRGAEPPTKIVDYYSTLTLPEKETLQQYDTHIYALCSRIEQDPVPNDLVKALQQDPLSLEAYNAAYGLQTNVSLGEFE